MSVMTMNHNDVVRQGLAGLSASRVLETVDALNLKGHTKLSAVVAMPLRSLQQKRDVTNFAATAPIVAVRAVLELIALEPLEKVVEALGDHADTPTYEQLRDALERVIEEGATRDDVLAVLSFAIGEQFPAAVHCRQLLEERPEYVLPELDYHAPGSLLAPKQVDERVKEQRKLRREEERRKKSTSPPKVARTTKPKRAPSPPSPKVPDAPVYDATPEILRRRINFTPAERTTFDPSHQLVGTVVLADVPFDATDPSLPELRSKMRPALVVAASENAMLVLGIYSNPSTSRTLFKPWRKLGLAHVSYLASDRTVVVQPPHEAEKLGRLSDEEWNSLF